ncbi:hypothetical protein ACFYNL_03875 [Streptomyces sp. NPDC007808]|uniref:hypothetical protein n=1 Tax=Streptomyces sp. NPDC007808 TaxID=3364779 RepID=UPI0036CC7513
MRFPCTLRTALVVTGVAAALAGSVAAALAAGAAARTVMSAARPPRAGRVHVKTVKLADRVSRAKVFRSGKNHHEAEIWADGSRCGILHAHGGPAYAQNNGLHVTLRPNGKVTSRFDGARPKPRPVGVRILVAAPTLADGATTAEVHRLTADHHEADILADGARITTLVAEGRAAYGENDGLHITLQPDGRLTSWMEDGSVSP